MRQVQGRYIDTRQIPGGYKRYEAATRGTRPVGGIFKDCKVSMRHLQGM